MTSTLPVIDRMPDHLTTPAASPDLLRSELLDVITDAINNAPRSLQVAIGPSEVGHPCARRLGYKMLGQPENQSEPNWKATVGTACHSWLEDTFIQDNPGQPARAEGFTRWIVEATVSCGELNGADLSGHCDLFDRVTGTVVDWKTTGPTQLKKYKANGPGEQYRVQAHLYGRGWARRGQQVNTVAVMFLPRNGELRDAYMWSEPYDERVALNGLKRAEGISLTVNSLGRSSLPLLPTADAYCQMCPYFRANSNDLSTGCPGDENARKPGNPFADLLG